MNKFGVAIVLALSLPTYALSRHHHPQPAPSPTPSPTSTPTPATWSDTFPGTTLNSTYWNTFMTSAAANGTRWNPSGGAGSAIGPVGSGYLDYDLPSAITVSNGLTLTATHQSSFPGYPWTSAVLTTYNKVEFLGGDIKVVAKQSSANGSWPAIWLLPGARSNQTHDIDETDIQEGNFIGTEGPPANMLAYHFHEANNTTVGGQFNFNTDLSAGFNTYEIVWLPNKSITWLFNGTPIFNTTTSLPNFPMELILNQGVSSICSWRTCVDSSTPSTLPFYIQSVTYTPVPGSSLFLGPK